MKTQKILLLVSTIAALAFGVTAQATTTVPYVRAGGEYTKFRATSNFDDFSKWEVGAAIESGVVLNGAHSIGLEISYVEAKSNVTYNGLVASDFKIKKQQMPILVAYRYTYPFTNVFSVYGGVTAGMMMDKYSLDTGNPLGSGNTTNWIPAAGVIGGINLGMGGGWYFTAGVRLLEVWPKIYKNIDPGKILQVGDGKSYVRPTFTLGIGYKW